MLRTTLAATVVAVSAGAAAAVTVDNFDTTATTGPIVGTAGATGSFSDAGGIGTSREAVVSIDSTANGLVGEVKADSNTNNNDRFNFESDSLTFGSFTLSYSGLGGLDLSGLPLLFQDVVNDSAFSLNVAITSGGSTSSADFSIASSNTFETLAFDLSTIAGVDSVDDIVFTFASEDLGGDISFGAISQIPVPATGLLLIGALGGIAALRRRQAA